MTMYPFLTLHLRIKEREFSDDEVELEHKKNLKRKRALEIGRRGNGRRSENRSGSDERDQFLAYRPLSRPSHHPSVHPIASVEQFQRRPDQQVEMEHHTQPSPAFVAPHYWAQYSPSPPPYAQSLALATTQIPQYPSLPPGAYVNPTFLARGQRPPLLQSPSLPPDIQQQIDILNSVQRRNPG